MKNKHVLLLFLGLIFLSCKKEFVHLTSLSSLNLINAVINGWNLKINDNKTDSAKISNSKLFSLVSGVSNVLIYPTNDQSKPYLNGTFELDHGRNYSLFLFGQSPNIDTLFMKDDIPSFYSDSSVGVRFVNLSPNLGAVKVTTALDITNSVFGNISYKELTNFYKIALPTKIVAGSITFQIRDVVTNSILATYTLPTVVNSNYPGISVQLSRFKNITMVIKGLKGTATGVNALGVFPVANY